MILVTGGTGKTGRALITQLAKKQIKTRAWVRRADAEIIGATELFVGDMENPADWSKAFNGVHKVYHICPNMHPNEVAIGQMAIQAAVAARAEHFVYHSVLHPHIQEMPHHWNKLLIEEQLFKSGLPFTILQPTAYMQNLLPQLDSIKKDGVLRLPYPAATRLALIDLNDVAEAAAVVLASSRFVGAILELVGTDPLNQHEVMQLFDKPLKRKITYAEIPLEKWEADNQHLPAYARETLLAMFRYYAKYGLIGNRAALKMILQRRPTDLAAWANRG